MDSSTKSSDLENLSELIRIRNEYKNTTNNIIALMPTLICMVDFQKTGDFKLVCQRMKEGYYGKVENGSFVAPETGPYKGFLSNMNKETHDKFMDLIQIE